ncbi:TetR/AcrR family transcriptional regulator [Bradyrhizobium jicamae]|uniref:TetR/AcrR family transcriptional regulator n=1 Tax=Bradyrhizobium jicamae TaxID=280332 RepID=A0ABS5FNP6_9BRAD|nr:TetR/AcrR family transcriptional regulator [Bradyrhizobium jicamae]MBR0798371.1 TetR/AcrR family transcriptional regulator [Bradyrhizobium jicamae]MBR0936287.1 TetR/AcrR family transcriptional regulator [Bradyrhizobium jicamae]
MPPRSYVSPARSAAAAETRERVIAAASQALREGESIARFSLDSVAKAAGVTRLTVYNQFGSRRGLLEAVFDEIGRSGGLHRLADIMTMGDPRAALDRLAEIFCAFWSGDAAVGRLNDAMATDPEFAEAVRERNERRRKSLTVLIDRLAAKTASAHARKDAVDLIFALTGYPTYAALSPGRSRDDVCRVVQAACRAAIEPLSDRPD